MNILVIGAGVIGSLYAARLSERGHEVTLLARGQRFESITEHGILIREEGAEDIERVRISCVRTIDESVWYDYCFIAVRYDQVEELLPSLARVRCGNLVSMVNSPEGLGILRSVKNPAVLLCAFPGAGGRREGELIIYHILSPLVQSTAVGYAMKSRKGEACRCAELLKGAGFPVSMYDDIDSYLLTHVALIAPLCFLVYALDASLPETQAWRIAIDSLKEGLGSIKDERHTIRPRRLGLLRYLPRPLLSACLRILSATEFFETVIAAHARYATDEITLMCHSFTTRQENRFASDLPTYRKGMSMIPGRESDETY